VQAIARSSRRHAVATTVRNCGSSVWVPRPQRGASENRFFSTPCRARTRRTLSIPTMRDMISEPEAPDDRDDDPHDETQAIPPIPIPRSSRTLCRHDPSRDSNVRLRTDRGENESVSLTPAQQPNDSIMLPRPRAFVPPGRWPPSHGTILRSSSLISCSTVEPGRRTATTRARLQAHRPGAQC